MTTANLPPKPSALDLRGREKLARLLKRGDFTAKAGETWLIDRSRRHSCRTRAAGGPGSKAPASGRNLAQGLAPRGVSGHQRRDSHAHHLSGAGTAAPAAKLLSDERLGRAVAELTGHTLYRVNDLKSAKKPRAHALARVVVVAPAEVVAGDPEGLLPRHPRSRAAPRSCATSPIFRAMSARPAILAKTAQDLAKTYKSLRVKVLGLPEIKREKMGCFLAVTQGSEEPPRFLVIEHRHPRAKGCSRGARGQRHHLRHGWYLAQRPARPWTK